MRKFQEVHSFARSKLATHFRFFNVAERDNKHALTLTNNENLIAAELSIFNRCICYHMLFKFGS
jgi:hypothetical protein